MWFVFLSNSADESAKSSAVVDAVARLCETRDSFTLQLTDVLQVDDTDRYRGDYDSCGHSSHYRMYMYIVPKRRSD